MKLSKRTRAITLEVILRAVFGVEAERMGALRDAIGGLLTPGQTPALLLNAIRRPVEARPTGGIGRALDHLDKVIYAEIARRRSQEDLGERADILSLLMLARDEDGQAMSDEELRDELVTLLVGRARDDRHRGCLGGGATGAPPGQARATGRRDR